LKWWTGLTALQKFLVILGASATATAGGTGGYLTYQEYRPKGTLVEYSVSHRERSELLVILHGKIEGEQEGQGFSKDWLERYFSIALSGLKAASQGELTKRYDIYFYTYNPRCGVEPVARDLVRRLRNENFRERRIRFLAHSYGGLIARKATNSLGSSAVQIITLGTPHHGTPIQVSPWVDQTADKLYTLLGAGLLKKLKAKQFDFQSAAARNLCFDNWDGSMPSSLVAEKNQWLARFNSHDPSLAKLFVYAGRIPKRSRGWWKRNLDVLQVVTSPWWFNDRAVSERQEYEISSFLLWNMEKEVWNDGLVPVTSALAKGMVPRERQRFFDDYDHAQILSGKGLDLTLARKIWQDLSIPASRLLAANEDWSSLHKFPDLPELDLSAFLKSGRLSWVRFLFVRRGELWGADENWRKVQLIAAIGDRLYEPRVREGRILLTAERKGIPRVYLVDSDGLAKPIIEVPSRMAAWSSDGKSVVYEMDGNLVRQHLPSGRIRVLVKGVSLVEPPLWTSGLFGGKVYFIAKKDNKTPLYAVSDRQQNLRLSELKPALANISTAVNLKGNILVFSLGYESEEKSSGPYAEIVLVKARFGWSWLKRFHPRIKAGKDFSFQRGTFTMPYFKVADGILWDRGRIYLTVVLGSSSYLIAVDQKAFQSAAAELAGKVEELWRAGKKFVETGEAQKVDLSWQGPSWDDVVPFTLEDIEDLVLYN